MAASQHRCYVAVQHKTASKTQEFIYNDVQRCEWILIISLGQVTEVASIMDVNKLKQINAQPKMTLRTLDELYKSLRENNRALELLQLCPGR